MPIETRAEAKFYSNKQCPKIAKKEWNKPHGTNCFNEFCCSRNQKTGTKKKHHVPDFGHVLFHHKNRSYALLSFLFISLGTSGTRKYKETVEVVNIGIYTPLNTKYRELSKSFLFLFQDRIQHGRKAHRTKPKKSGSKNRGTSCQTHLTRHCRNARSAPSPTRRAHHLRRTESTERPSSTNPKKKTRATTSLRLHRPHHQQSTSDR